MKLISALQNILKVESNSRVNLLLELNDGYSLLIEGGFSVSRKEDKLVNSIQYIGSDFSPELLNKIQSSLENQIIKVAAFSKETGKLILGLCCT
jgi:hypothetical protein